VDNGWINISTGSDEAVWFFAMYVGLGIRRTPPGSQRMWPGAADSACRALRLCPDAMATRNTVLIVTSLSDASANGSKGALARASRTFGRLHEGSSFLTGGLLRKRARNSLPRVGESETLCPSACTAAIAER